MVILSYIFLGVFINFGVMFIAINFGNLIGGNDGELMIASSIAILCSIVVICTLIIRDTIRNSNK